jgi:hypothetical protein
MKCQETGGRVKILNFDDLHGRVNQVNHKNMAIAHGVVLKSSNPGKILILFSGKREANALLYQSPIRFENHSGSYHAKYRGREIELAICGIGQKAIKSFIGKRLPVTASLVIKAGTCAVTRPEIPLLQPLIPSFSALYNQQGFSEKLMINLSPLPEELARYRLDHGIVTVEKELNTPDMIKALNDEYAMVEMEFHYLLQGLDQLHVLSIVVGTDRGTQSASRDFFASVSSASGVLKDVIVDFFNSQVTD